MIQHSISPIHALRVVNYFGLSFLHPFHFSFVTLQTFSVRLFGSSIVFAFAPSNDKRWVPLSMDSYLWKKGTSRREKDQANNG